MVNIDTSKVLELFQNLSECPSEKLTSLTPLVENSTFSVEGIIDENKYTDEYKSRCEYAAAAYAFYNYACREGAREKIICTLEGKMTSSENNQKAENKIRWAKELKIQSIVSISSILKDNDFLFKAI